MSVSYWHISAAVLILITSGLLILCSQLHFLSMVSQAILFSGLGQKSFILGMV